MSNVSPSTDRTVAVSDEPDKFDGRLFPQLMRAWRGWLKSKPAEELAVILGCSVRSAERYLAGMHTPDAEAVFAILESDHGAAMVELAVSKFPPARQRAFWKEIDKAVQRALWRERDAEHQAEKAKLGL